MAGGLEKAARKEIDREKAQAARELHHARSVAAATASELNQRHTARGSALVDLLSAIFR